MTKRDDGEIMAEAIDELFKLTNPGPEWASYADRKVGRYDSDDNTKMVSTAKVPDGAKPYETAVAHPEFNGGNMIIVDNYDTFGDAEAGHTHWVNLVRNDNLPNPLCDVANSRISQLGKEAGCQMQFKREKVT